MITFCLNALCWHTWTSTSLLINTFSKYFLDYPKLGLFSAESVDTESVNTRGACAGRTHIKVSCIRNTFAKDICIMGASMGNLYVRDTCTKGTCIAIKNPISGNSFIHNSANNLFKFAVLNLRLLVHSKLGRLISFCFYLQVNLDKIL